MCLETRRPLRARLLKRTRLLTALGQALGDAVEHGGDDSGIRAGCLGLLAFLLLEEELLALLGDHLERVSQLRFALLKIGGTEPPGGEQCFEEILTGSGGDRRTRCRLRRIQRGRKSAPRQGCLSCSGIG